MSFKNKIFPPKILLDQIYSYLWIKSDIQSESFSLHIPQTIIFQHSQPIMWYYSDAKGIIKKKKTKNLKREIIYEKLTKVVPKCKIVAYLIYPTSAESQHDPRNHTKSQQFSFIDDQTQAKIQYFEQQDLEDFLYQNKINSGILQQFIDTGADYNSAHSPQPTSASAPQPSPFQLSSSELGESSLRTRARQQILCAREGGRVTKTGCKIY